MTKARRTLRHYRLQVQHVNYSTPAPSTISQARPKREKVPLVQLYETGFKIPAVHSCDKIVKIT